MYLSSRTDVLPKTGQSCLSSAFRRVLLHFLFPLSFLVFFAAAPASAQSASFRAVDTNSDGVLSQSELVAAFGREGANRLLRSTDHNADGRITIPELRRGPNENDDDDSQQSAGDRDDNHDDDRDDDDGRDGDDGGDDGDNGGEDGGDDGGDND